MHVGKLVRDAGNQVSSQLHRPLQQDGDHPDDQQRRSLPQAAQISSPTINSRLHTAHAKSSRLLQLQHLLFPGASVQHHAYKHLSEAQV